MWLSPVAMRSSPHEEAGEAACLFLSAQVLVTAKISEDRSFLVRRALRQLCHFQFQTKRKSSTLRSRDQIRRLPGIARPVVQLIVNLVVRDQVPPGADD